MKTRLLMPAAALAALLLTFVSTAATPAFAAWTVTNLKPSGASDFFTYDTSDSQQAGFAYINGNADAGIWSGTSNSWVDLNPSKATMSAATALSGTQQAGMALICFGPQGPKPAGPNIRPPQRPLKMPSIIR